MPGSSGKCCSCVAWSTVLMTGGSGFVASHTIARLLAAGHEVRATVRSQARAVGLRDMLEKAGVEHQNRLSFFEADLEKDSGWMEAVTGSQYVLPSDEAITSRAESLVRLGLLEAGLRTDVSQTTAEVPGGV